MRLLHVKVFRLKPWSWSLAHPDLHQLCPFKDSGNAQETGLCLSVIALCGVQANRSFIILTPQP